jgi:two-component system, NarL family, response regulator NreC
VGADGNRVAIVLAADQAVVRRELGQLLDGAPASLDATCAVAQASPGTGVVVLVAQADAPFVRQALQAGAVACVLEDTPGEELVAAVRRAAEQALAAPPRGSRHPPDGLTAREFDVLRLLALGHTNAEVAARLHLSVRTVETHRAHLQRKLRRPSRAELVRYALDHGLLHASEDGART